MKIHEVLLAVLALAAPAALVAWGIFDLGTQHARTVCAVLRRNVRRGGSK